MVRHNLQFLHRIGGEILFVVFTFWEIIRILAAEEFVMEPYKILAVDDDRTLLQLLSSELINEGYETALAYDGTEALELLAKEIFDLIILDIKMPKLNGFDTLKHVKQHYPKTKVIMLTAYADITNALESKRLGADGFIDKPYDLIELLTTINRILTE